MQPGKQYFCRLSTRSPKDAVSLTEEEKTETDPSKRLLLKYRHLCVKDASYALELLSKSQRIFRFLMVVNVTKFHSAIYHISSSIEYQARPRTECLLS